MTAAAPLPPGLYVVATPIGNMGDFSDRAREVLRAVDLVACEDTRTSAPLLNAAGSSARRIAVHEHNEDAVAQDVVDRIAAGQSVALISDAGTPLVSDPGFPVVKRVAAAGLRVVPVPGASSVLAALSASGLPTARFHFAGFLPDRAARRQALLAELSDLTATLVFFAPARELVTVLGWLREGLGDRPAVVARELTKLHEEFRRGPLSALSADPPVALGEAVVLVDGAPDSVPDEAGLDHAIRAALAAGEAPSALAKRLAREHRVGRSVVYERILALKGA